MSGFGKHARVVLLLFSAYLEIGFGHISDLKGSDHILFIIVLCAVYNFSDWRKIAILVTEFTIGYSITLALSALKIVVGNSYWIELLIPVTILFTSIHNITYPARNLVQKRSIFIIIYWH